MLLCNQSLRSALLEELLALPFQAHVRAITELLKRMGYENITIGARTGFVGRNSDGGCDLRANRVIPGGRRSVVVQIKQYPIERQIYRRTLDELRGVALRQGAAEALLITTSAFSPSVNEAAYSAAQLVPVRLIDHVQLAELLALYRVGVMKNSTALKPGESQYKVDHAFFREIAKGYPRAARAVNGEQLRLDVVLSMKHRSRRR